MKEGERFGKFVLTRRIGSGGMGEVWQAHDPGVNRSVALKLLKSEGEQETARFRREAQLAGRLSHPNIAAIYETGVEEGRPWIAMQFVAGTTLKGAGGSRRDRVALVRDAALAVHHAHTQGIIHRDLKPDNVMVSEGRVFVMDFGLAKPTREISSLTASNVAVGTPAYMAPEQALGHSREVDERTDVYGLGATLYEVVTGRAPFLGDTMLDIAMQVVNDDPVKPWVLVPDVERDLETIVMKCLDKERERRYANARELADDLARFLNGEEIASRPPSFALRLKRRLAKRKAVAGLAAAAVVIAVLVPVVWRSTRGQAQAERALRLWDRLSSLMHEAELASRLGDRRRADAKLGAGIGVCRTYLAGDELAHARYFLGRFLRLSGRRAEAKAELAKAGELGEARYELGLMAVEEYDERLRQLQKSGEERPVVEIEAGDEELKALREVARRELSIKVGVSSFFRESDGQFGRGELARLRGDPSARRELEEVLKLDAYHTLARVSLAKLSLGEENLDEAIARATEAVEQHRGLAEALLVRADAYHTRWLRRREAADVERSREDGLRAVALEPENRLARLTLGMALMSGGEPTKAIEQYQAAMKLDPEWVDPYYNRAMARRMMGETKGAIADYDLVISKRPTAASAYVNRGDAKRALGDVEGCIRDLDRALELNPGLGPAYVNRGLAQRDRGRWDLARADFEKAVQLVPGSAGPWSYRGEAKRAAGDFDGAWADYEEALKREPAFAPALVGRAFVRIARGDATGAIQDLDLALRADPNYIDGWNARGLQKLRLGDADGARRDFDEALRRDERHLGALVNRGQLKYQLGDMEGAIADADAALRVDGSLPQALNNRGNACFMLGRLDDAARDYTKAIAVAPDDPDPRNGRGCVLEKQGDIKGALADYDAAIARNGRHLDARMNRGRVRFNGGDHAGALEDLDAAVALSPRNPWAWCNRGAAKSGMGDDAGAVADFTKSLELEPGMVMAWLNRGWLYARKGEKARAVADTKRALALMDEEHPMRAVALERLRELEK